jgi:hypothetical protein
MDWYCAYGLVLLCLWIGIVVLMDFDSHTFFNYASEFPFTGDFDLVLVGRVGTPTSHYKSLVKPSDRVFHKDHREGQSKHSFF